jgi:hypothetical protein
MKFQLAWVTAKIEKNREFADGLAVRQLNRICHFDLLYHNR